MYFIKELYKYREMLYSLVQKDLRTRYKGSVLGFLWTFINPLFQLIVYSIAFSFVMRIQMDYYYMYMFVGLLPWMFFCACIQGGATSIVAGQDLIKKIYFPRIILPIATVSAAFMNMIFSMVIMFIALFVSGIGVSYYIFYLPVLMLVLYLFGLSLSFIFSALNVYFRDLEHILGILSMSLFYVTPVIYPVSMVPTEFLPYFYFNPMFTMISAFHDILYYQRIPELQTVGIILGYTMVLLIMGVFIFQKLQKNFVEEL